MAPPGFGTEGASDEITGAMSSVRLNDSQSSRGTNKKDELMMVHSFLHTRPKHIDSKLGEKGEPVTCISNHLPVTSASDWLLYQYHVEFSPTVDSKAFRIKMLAEHAETIGMSDLIFDGAILFLPYKISNDTLISKHPSTQEKVELRIKITNELPANSPQSITLLNLCLRRALHQMQYKQIGRYFYNPNQAATVPKHKLEIWPGVISAIRVHEEQLLLCCEMSHKVLRTESVLDAMHNLYNNHKDNFIERCTQLLVGGTVLARYSNKTYRVDDIAWDKTPESKFDGSDGVTLSFAEYYKQQYNRVIRDLRQPLLVSRVKRRGMPVRGKEPPEMIHLVPELCSMTGLTDQMRSDRRVMQDLAVYARVPPAMRLQHVRSISDSLNGTSSICREAILQAKDKELRYDPRVGDWAREARSCPLTDAKTLNKWLLLFPEKDRNQAEQFFNSIRTIGNQIGVRISPPYIIPLADERVGTYLEAIKYGQTVFGGERPDMVVTMLPNDNKTRYDAIKKLCCLDQPGEAPMKNLMVIGYDSYHDSSERGKSAGSAVFSLNPDLTRWYSQCALHTDTQDLIGNLKRFCYNGLLKYHETNGVLPDRIVLYRSGCGDGQIPVVYNYELPQVKKAMAEVGQKLSVSYDPRLSFVIVNKRVNTRLFEQKSSGEVDNPRPGTVVDSVVTRPERYDFYLVPQRVSQGTVTPVSYNVIYDQSRLKPDHMQRLAFKLCHLYYNWQGTIRIPAPCQYAHKLAFLVGQSLHQPPDQQLSDKLYFL